ncbi:MAG: hypothetical protein LWW93_07370 [Hyphomicrobiales bacterium]|nr:hypothetical protein [Hyphomicrobiales bacterium]
MVTNRKTIAFLSALVVTGASALAVARDQASTPGDLVQVATTPDSCPPSACTIVVKTDRRGPPSRLVAVD